MQVMPAFFEGGKPDALKAALADLCAAAEAAVRDDAAGCLVLSDRDDDAPLSESRVPIPTLLAVGAVHHHLIAAGLRSDTSIVAETAQAFSTHHIAVLVGYGAHAVCPYLAFESLRALHKDGKLGTGLSWDDIQVCCPLDVVLLDICNICNVCMCYDVVLKCVHLWSRAVSSSRTSLAEEQRDQRPRMFEKQAFSLPAAPHVHGPHACRPSTPRLSASASSR